MAKMVDRVLDTANNPDQIRNIAICAHIDHGKTTLSDNLLAGAGMMSDELAGKACMLDFHDDEKERGITIDSAVVSMVHTIKNTDFLINLMDTPGHVDFGGDVTRAMRAVDGAVVLVDAVEGMMPQTETVLRQALREKVKPILFINKVDRLIKELKLTPEAMLEKFTKIIANVNKFIREHAPSEFKNDWTINAADGSVCFGSGYNNWALSIPFMQENGVKLSDIIDAYENDSLDEMKKKAALHDVLLGSVVKHLPNPEKAQSYRISKLWHGDLESEDGKSLLATNVKGPLYFVIVKIVVDPQAGEICAGRLFSGTVKKGMEVTLNRANAKSRIQQVFIYNGAKRELVDHAVAGNIVGISGIKGGMPGETITINPSEPFEEIKHIFDPVVTKSIKAKNPADLSKLLDVLRQVHKEDPTLIIESNQETGENLISGMGELHLEVIENRLVKEKKVEVVSSPPIVVYRESISSNNTDNPFEGKSPNKHNKLYFTVEPLPENIKEAIKEGNISNGRVKKSEDTAAALRELGYDAKFAKSVKDVYNGNLFIDATRGIVHIGEIIEMVMDSFEDVMENGPLAREPCVDVMIKLTDCKLHEDTIHRGPAQIYPAVREGIRGAMNEAKPLIFEPLQTLQFDSPQEFVGNISSLISNKRGQLLDMEQEGANSIVKAKLPVAEMFGLTNDLRSATGGRGIFFVIDQGYDLLPYELQQNTVKSIRERKDLSENQ